ncbi:hypothetical protein BaRGS_00038025 [Batillaria attramentaria]|uniref:Uncharacterized protein n=1 Tax=Batillaria attramentaria TaxID=370345 RepID=A0ABD0J702_9CAEN
MSRNDGAGETTVTKTDGASPGEKRGPGDKVPLPLSGGPLILGRGKLTSSSTRVTAPASRGCNQDIGARGREFRGRGENLDRLYCPRGVPDTLPATRS